MQRVLEPTRGEPGCIRINLYEATRGPAVFYLHSEWVDEAAFEEHARLPHTLDFLSVLDELITHPLQALRTKQIA